MHFLCAAKGKWRENLSSIGFDMLLCNECNFIFVTVCVSAVWSPSVMPIKHQVNYCELREMRERRSLHFPLF